MRMFGPGYEELYRKAQEKYNIKFLRGRVSEAAENQDKQIIIKAEDTLVGKPIRMTMDLLVLMVGMEASEGSRNWAKQLQLKVSPNGFIQPKDPHFATNTTEVEGVFIAGSCSSPMNLTDTLTDARSAATTIQAFLSKK
jgi:heterodisulfide reductase subunit A